MTNRKPRKNDSRATKKNGWESAATALQGVPQNEIDAHKKVKDGCWQCGRTGHRTFDCFSFQNSTRNGATTRTLENISRS